MKKCPACSVTNEDDSPVCINCHHRLAPPTYDLSAPNLATLELVPEPRDGSAFRRCSDTEIERYAKGQLTSGDRAVGMAGSGLLFFTAPWLIVLGFVALLIPVIGIFICIVFVGGGLLMFLGAGFPALIGFAKPANSAELAGLKYQYRLLAEGDCPVCSSSIYFIPSGDNCIASCPKCSAPLLYESGWVIPS